MTHRTVLWISAHPEPRSLNHHLRRSGIDHLKELGHTIVESDLYAMDWNPVVTRSDAGIDAGERFRASEDVRTAYRKNRLPADVVAEQEKLQRADALVVQFPLWWYGMPAILKGWFDRVFVSGFAFGKDPDTGKRLRYEQGPFVGKRALAAVTVGDRPASIGPRGKSGDLTELLFGLLHGTFAYTGMSVLPPWALPSADFISDYDAAKDSLLLRLTDLFTQPTIPYRPQFTGQYTDEWALRPDILPQETGLSIHIEG
ncbi:NAD(P)H-dependent oxidoreductase [Nesterenkonia aerolata]|uniref:NAD(P)H-dependent oxidoreductase n=1 Tax=Nesterenkonia aerolata TaxID=3074079 RepID=A0ABU2DVD3_9MICC|nr:NAD(P)H-dependent oxidoreductase [Nesterenkonia sp. LY-0111]MDR8020473.1 NAD(P)H-dependent oxidoreductase [Nesterenkonia sp. LY-0111]